MRARFARSLSSISGVGLRPVCVCEGLPCAIVENDPILCFVHHHFRHMKDMDCNGFSATSDTSTDQLATPNTANGIHRIGDLAETAHTYAVAAYRIHWACLSVSDSIEVRLPVLLSCTYALCRAWVRIARLVVMLVEAEESDAHFHLICTAQWQKKS